MLLFRTSRGARFRCQADFSTDLALNLHFFDAARRTIPFHVSLRRDEQLIVVNRRSSAGWHREIGFAASFSRNPVAVDINFGVWGVTLRVDGRLIGRFDRLPRRDPAGRLHLRRGFAHLGRIAFVDIEGAIMPESLLIDGPARRASHPARPLVNDAFEVVLDVPSAEIARHRGQARLQVEGFDEAIPAVLRALPYAAPGGPAGQRVHALVAVVPGRVWDSGTDRLEMTLAGERGETLGTVALARDAVAQRIGMLAETGALVNDDRAALQAIEHARHAGILARLTPGQRDGLLRAAGRYRLAPYLLDGSAAAVPPPSSDGSEWQQIDAVRDRFTATMRAAPQADAPAVLRGLIDGAALSREARAVLLISLTEWFCLNGGMRDLACLWRGDGLDLAAALPRYDAWKLSALLPLYYTEGRFADVAEALRLLSRPTTAWMLSPCIGWVAGEIARSAPGLDGVPPGFDQRRAILQGVLRWVQGQAREYWGRADCLVLIRGVVAILAEAATLPASDQAALIRRVLRVYALSPAFWDAVDAARAQQDWPLPLPLQAAQQGFAGIRAVLADGAVDTPEGRARLDRLLHGFQDGRCVDLARFRRDLLGPAGVPLNPGAMPAPVASLRAGLAPEEAALRWVAHPLAADRSATMPDALAEAVRAGLEGAYDIVPKGPFAALQTRILRDSGALLLAADPAALTGLLTRLAPLASARGRFLGLGVGMALAKALLTQGRADEAGQVVQRVVALAGVVAANEAASLADTPAPALALAAMVRAHPGHALTQRLQAALEGRVARIAAPQAATDPDQPVNPLLDTLVCLYSCRANLDTRVQAIRDGWMRLLADLGVPCLVFVGDGDGRREGDVVHLAAPDDYEGLPAKTLALVRWVHDHTDFSYMVKVDDDSFLDPQAFFGDLAYQKFDYYGRPLERR
ncbi:MAG: hypothetical protein KJZ59_00320, partial [Pararhodobacter sp.]|nr:hypothetical protein [Pararhodobacter sp.]